MSRDASGSYGSEQPERAEPARQPDATGPREPAGSVTGDGRPEPLEGADGFRERLWPSPGIWATTIAFAAGLGLIPAPVSATAAVATGLTAVLAAVIFMVVTTPTVTVGAGVLRAGRAGIPVRLVADAQPLDAEQMRQARGPRLDARAYLCLRGWLPTGVRVSLADPEDPTPYWLVSSRRPQALARALTAGPGQGPA